MRKIFWLLGLTIGSIFLPKMAMAAAPLADFENGLGGWNGGAIVAGFNSNSALRLSNPASGSIEVRENFNAPILNGASAVAFEINLNGNMLKDGDAGALIIDQNGWKMVPLKNYVQNGLDDWQTVTIPFSSFPGLDPDQGIASLILRIWNENAGNYDFDNLRLTTNQTQTDNGQNNNTQNQSEINGDNNQTNNQTISQSGNGQVLADFNTGPDGFDRGSVENGLLVLSNPENGDASTKKLINAKILQGHEALEMDINLNGNYLLDGDAAQIFFDQAGPKSINLKNRLENGSRNWQHLRISLSEFAGLNPNEGVASINFRFWNYRSGSYYIDNIVLSGNGSTPVTPTNPTTPPANPTNPPESNNNNSTSWSIKSIDSQVMSKYWGISDTSQIRALVKANKSLGAKQIAVSINYDYYDLLKTWADVIHNEGLNVWYRSHWNDWDSWEKPEIKNGITDEEYLARTKQFILDHPNLFREGDAFTMCVESENAAWWTGIDRGAFSGWDDWLEFTRLQVTEANDVFARIGLSGKIHTNWINMNGWVAWNILDEQTANTLGQLTLDHIIDNVDDINTYAHHLFQGDSRGFYGYDEYYNKFRLPIMAGEWGYSTWNMSIDPSHQKELTEAVMREFRSRDYILGLNYWIDVGHASRLFDNDRDLHIYTKRPVADTIANYFA